MENNVVSKSIYELFGIDNDQSKAASLEVNTSAHPFVPIKDAAYLFKEDDIRKVLYWHFGVAGKNLLITGPTGSGKSSLIEQFCARVGKALYRVACHGRMEFADLNGQIVIKANGATEFNLGPLPRAMKEGAVFLLDEGNFIHPSAIGALNTVLDGGPLLIPETSEVIIPHDDFRIVMTGNSVDNGEDSTLYRGTQRMNLAFIQRFLIIKSNYLSKEDEAKMLHMSEPNLDGAVIGALVSGADDIRVQYLNGEISTTLSTRTLVKISKILVAKCKGTSPTRDDVHFALNFVFCDALNNVEADSIRSIMDRYIPD